MALQRNTFLYPDHCMRRLKEVEPSLFDLAEEPVFRPANLSQPSYFMSGQEVSVVLTDRSSTV
ncbi:hypothetical protein CCL13_12435 [Pseudomonas syringae]|nr:hypothetical protein CCL13_12435 [Pseudomonas syringae]